MPLFGDQVVSYRAKKAPGFNRPQIPMPSRFATDRRSFQHPGITAEVIMQPYDHLAVGVGHGNQRFRSFAFSHSTRKRYAPFAIKNASRICPYVWRELQERCFSFGLRGSSDYVGMARRCPLAPTWATIGRAGMLQSNLAARTHGFPGSDDFWRFSFKSERVLAFVFAATRKTVTLPWLLGSRFAAWAYRLNWSRHIGYDTTLGGNVRPDFSGHGWKNQERQVVGHL